MMRSMMRVVRSIVLLAIVIQMIVAILLLVLQIGSDHYHHLGTIGEIVIMKVEQQPIMMRIIPWKPRINFDFFQTLQ
jgi:hypothetical protein